MRATGAALSWRNTQVKGSPEPAGNGSLTAPEFRIAVVAGTPGTHKPPGGHTGDHGGH
jgi:hypothetical protein